MWDKRPLLGRVLNESGRKGTVLCHCLAPGSGSEPQILETLTDIGCWAVPLLPVVAAWKVVSILPSGTPPLDLALGIFPLAWSSPSSFLDPQPGCFQNEKYQFP